MSIETALEILTAPKLTERQHLVKLLAERCKNRSKGNFSPRHDDVWYVIAIALRWQLITKQDMPSLSRLALGRLQQDIYDLWTLLVQNAI